MLPSSAFLHCNRDVCFCISQFYGFVSILQRLIPEWMVSQLLRPMTLPAWMTLLDVSPLFPGPHCWIQGPFRHPHVSSLSRRHYCCCLPGRHPFRVKKPRSPLQQQHCWSLQGRFACFLSCAGLESNLPLHHLRKLKMELNNSTTIVFTLTWRLSFHRNNFMATGLCYLSSSVN